MATSKVEDWHRRAMEIADDAFSCEVRAKRVFADALAFETRAANAVACKPENEPSRSVLYRSAAALALHAAQPQEAVSLAKDGLAGTPPPEICAELEKIVEEAARKGETERVSAMALVERLHAQAEAAHAAWWSMVDDPHAEAEVLSALAWADLKAATAALSAGLAMEELSRDGTR